jgi:putative tryptophan/tyrosine transport system substrate-binding protein
MYRILRGTPPSDLPVQSPVDLLSAINLRTVQRLGLTIPDALLQRVDVVIR